MKKQQPGPLTPMAFKKDSGTRIPSTEERELDIDVTSALLNAVEAVTTEELPEDAQFFLLNCTYALIRWLPAEPDLERIERLLLHRHMSTRMKQNLVYALFRRYGAEIPERFRESPQLAGLWQEVPLPLDCDEETSNLIRSMTTPSKAMSA